MAEGSPPFDAATLAIVRRAYARQMLALAGASGDHRLEAAFAAVPRERFLGDPPWGLVGTNASRILCETNDPVVLYQPFLVQLVPTQRINNGSPVLHAQWLHQAGLAPGDRVVHVGAGTGYYTAIMAELVGPGGQVLAVEFDPTLADRAAQALAGVTHVTVTCADGMAWPQEPVDCVYVSFAVSRPAEAWVDHLGPGGRLLFPLCVADPVRLPAGGGWGGGFRITRQATGFAARYLGPVAFVWASGAAAAPDGDHARLKAAFDAGGMDRVTRLVWRQPAPAADRCWFATDSWSLTMDAAT